ncbi:MAG TPA: VWA domain-containing protein [Blastocatellia bacterium]|nr:VWA domain-containing protein [Blastocatellia bacterium]
MKGSRVRSSRRFARLSLLGVVLVGISISIVSGQDKNRSEQDEEIRLETTLVQIPTVVRDKGGRYVLDLRKEDFIIYEDGLRQNVEFFGTVEEPFSVALLLDTSGSTASQLEFIKSSAIAFIDSLRPHDRVMVIGFNDSVEVKCEMTGNRDVLYSAVKSLTPGEYTQVYEAVYTAVWERLRDLPGRKAVIMFSDGIDTASSEIVAEDTLDAVIESEDVIMYVIRYNTRGDVERKLEKKVVGGQFVEGGKGIPWDEKRRQLDEAYKEADEYLGQLAVLSGGIVEKADELIDLKTSFRRIADELRQQYLLGYYPSKKGKADQDRKVDVIVMRPGLKVRTRPAYRLAR